MVKAGAVKYQLGLFDRACATALSRLPNVFVGTEVPLLGGSKALLLPVLFHADQVLSIDFRFAYLFVQCIEFLQVAPMSGMRQVIKVNMLHFLVVVCVVCLHTAYGGSLGAVVNTMSGTQAAPTFGNVTTRTSASLLIHFPVMEVLGGGNTVAYEVSKRSLLNAHWEVVKDDLGTSGKDMSEVQIIEIHVDTTSMMTGGTFELGITRTGTDQAATVGSNIGNAGLAKKSSTGLTPEDFQHAARTTPIAYDATAAQMLQALQALTNVRVREVKRCDVFGDGGGTSDVGHGGFEQWLSGCPQGSLGAFRWLVVFDLPVGTSGGGDSQPVYNMFLYRNDLQGAWTGAGAQVTVHRLIRGMIAPSLCLHMVCSYNVTGLAAGTPYSFRVRSFVDLGGSGGVAATGSQDRNSKISKHGQGAGSAGIWTDYSKTSEFVQTLELRPPGRMKPPVSISVGVSNALLTVKLPSAVQGTHTIHSEYRPLHATQWEPGPSVDLLTYSNDAAAPGVSGAGAAGEGGFTLGKSIILNLKDLMPNTAYEARCQAVNKYGASLFSSSSQVFTTTADFAQAYVPVPPTVTEDVADAVGSAYVDVNVHSNPSELIAAKPVTYRLQYRSEIEKHWHSYPQVVKFQSRKEGVEIQKIVSRSSGDRFTYDVGGNLIATTFTECVGKFYLRIGAVASDEVSETVSRGISFDASVEALVAALYTIGKVKKANPRITAHRVPNEYNGFTWTVEIQGMGDIPRIQLHKHTLYASEVSTSNKVGECYEEAPADPVLSATLQNGPDIFSQAKKTLRIGGLESQRGYYFRVQELDTSNHNAPGAVSNVTFVKTKPDFVSSTLEGTVGLDGESHKLVGNINPRPKLGKKTGPAVAYNGLGHIPAKANDISYHEGAGIGGTSGQPGGAGFCSAVSYTSRKSQPTQNYKFYFTGAQQQFIIPPDNPTSGTISIMTFKCWGGGGGGGKLSDLTGVNVAITKMLSAGGGGAFAQVSVNVNPGDIFIINIAGGGAPNRGDRGGKGGYGNGGDGGDALNGGGGGGGGLTQIRRGKELLLVAAGGGGGGSTDYCCASGGAGGGEGEGESGKAPMDNSPWPITNFFNNRTTPVIRRFEYTSSVCPTDLTGDFCISEWDILPGSLPALHKNLQWGAALNANFSVWATPGGGGDWTVGGAPGVTSSFQVRTAGPGSTLDFDGRAAVYSQGKGIESRGMKGLYLQGGTGAGGKEGGGGGGAGYWGGGGGGSGIDAGGGGGGSSFFNLTAATAFDDELLTALIPAPVVIFVNDSAVCFKWKLKWDDALWGMARSYDVEISYGPDSEDFERLSQVSVDMEGSAVRGSREAISEYTAMHLMPQTTYSFRVVPIYPKGRGSPSRPVITTTLSLAKNYWEPVTSRRLSQIASGRGFSNPALQRPHLTPGVEIFASETSANSARYSDPTTSEAQAFPAPRRGSTLSLVDDSLYMFGGRSIGYSCASTYKDTLSRGTPESGREVYPCSTQTAESNEMWSFDIHHYRWIFINTTAMAASLPPPARELHTSTVIGGYIYVLGGKTRTFPTDPVTKTPIFNYHSDVIHGDFWKFKVPQPELVAMDWPQPLEISNSVAPLRIDQDKRMFVTLDGLAIIGASPVNGDSINARIGKCIDRVVVTVKVRHPCINQLRVSIMGPSPDTGSPNFHAHSASHEVLLYNQRKTNGTGCALGATENAVAGVHYFIFSEDATRFLDECCVVGYDGEYKPEGRLSEFIGSSFLNEWTLTLQDMKMDSLVGELIEWSIDFTVSECFKVHTWTDLTPTITANAAAAPVARYGAKAMTYLTSLYVFGGRDNTDAALSDLHRFDTATSVWTKLTPVNFKIALDTASSIGASFALTSWGVIRFGGYYRQPYLPEKYDNYINDNFLLDPATMRWRKVEVDAWPQADGTGMTRPRPRYLAAVAFVPSKTLHFKKKYSYRNLYDQYPRSTHANYANALADSLLVYGGHDGATGGIFDGSTGGLLGDLWMLRLANFSTDGQRYKQSKHIYENCAWRNSAAAIALGTTSCTSVTPNTNCDFRDLLMLGWCGNTNQTMS